MTAVADPRRDASPGGYAGAKVLTLVPASRCVVETITVTAGRTPSSFTLSEMEMLVGSAIVLVVLAWMALSRMRRRPGSQA
ncbi:MAG: hypothetical protein JO341_11775 [Gammaproteobacteria bacterium]|nr:hypothetical protein [Gammaproteobacteria bacterium]MBV9621686.1 hypothetical protein [Gammaproteobacteria bacterium]